MDTIENKVSASGLVTFDLEEHYPEGDRVVIDIKDHLYEGLILREKEFRAFAKEEAWEKYSDKYVAITCTADAIVPTWAFMLLTTYLQPYAIKVVFGTAERLEEVLYNELIAKIDVSQYKGARVVIKGCSKINVPPAAYVHITERLRPVVKSIMYGEPCSTVPLYKAKKPKTD